MNDKNISRVVGTVYFVLGRNPPLPGKFYNPADLNLQQFHTIDRQKLSFAVNLVANDQHVQSLFKKWSSNVDVADWSERSRDFPKTIEKSKLENTQSFESLSLQR